MAGITKPAQIRIWQMQLSFKYRAACIDPCYTIHRGIHGHLSRASAAPQFTSDLAKPREVASVEWWDHTMGTGLDPETRQQPGFFCGFIKSSLCQQGIK